MYVLAFRGHGYGGGGTIAMMSKLDYETERILCNGSLVIM